MPNKPKYIKARGTRPNASSERKYRNKLLTATVAINELIRRDVVPLIKAKKATGAIPSGMADITKAFANIRKVVGIDYEAAESVGRSFVEQAAKQTNVKASSMLQKAGFDLPTNKDIIARQGLTESLEALTAENASLVTNMSQEYINRIQKAVLDNYLTDKYVGKGGILKELGRISGISKKRAKLIARDQSNKIHGTVTRLQAMATGSAGYEWNHVNDERVRGNPNGKYPKAKYSHWNRNDKYYLWKPMKNPPIAPNGKPFLQPPKDGSPGQPINCRCFASPIWIEN